MRKDGRKNDEMRLIKLTKDYIKHPEGSVLIEFGDTKVICNASVTEGVPIFLKGRNKGWVTAEYSMLPRATETRSSRESQKGKLSGRTQEISRLIGRSLRSIIDMNILGERTILIDCDVIQADGGTRTASITGGYLAMSLAVKWLMNHGHIENYPIKGYVCAVSAGVVGSSIVLDLNYEEDAQAGVDLNIVGTSDNKIIELQGTAEKSPFERKELLEMIDMGFKGISTIYEAQKNLLEGCC